MSASPPLPLAMRRSGWVLYVGLGEGLLDVTGRLHCAPRSCQHVPLNETVHAGDADC